MVRALTSLQCGPGSILGPDVMWVEFVVGSRPCSEGFSPGSPVFLPPQNATLLNSNSIWEQWMKSHFVEMPLQIPTIIIVIIIYTVFIYL